jgi:recombination protein RecA
MAKVVTEKQVPVETPNKDEKLARLKAVDLAVSQIEKQFGTGSIMKLGEAHKIDVKTTPSGSLSLDLALGGGIPQGRIIEIYGPESTGKTTLALHAVAQVQKQGGIAAFVDAEHALDPEYAARIGINLDDLLISQPDTGEQALEITETLVRSSAVNIIIVDSVAALVPRAEIENTMGEPTMGMQARLMSQALRKLAGVISKSNTTVIFINQLRMKIGVMFGNPETTAGGQALKYYASIRMDIRRVEQIKDGDKIIGNRVKVKIVKNKVAPPFRIAEFDVMYNQGISISGDLLDLAVKYEIVKKSGSWYEYKEAKMGQGREAAKAFIQENEKVMKELDQAVRKAAAV